MNHIYLLRHGENLANITLEFSHRKVDYSLTSKGVLQAQQTAAYLRDKHIQEIYSSPLKRAVETAEIVAAPLNLHVTVMEAFREVNVGELEGQKPTAALWKRHNAVVDAWHSGHPETRFPGGENLHELVSRANAGLEEILRGKEERIILIVGHGGIFSSSLRSLCSGLDESMMEGGMPNCSINEVEAGLVDGQILVRLLSFGFAGHLSGEASPMTGSAINDIRQLDAE